MDGPQHIRKETSERNKKKKKISGRKKTQLANPSLLFGEQKTHKLQLKMFEGRCFNRR